MLSIRLSTRGARIALCASVSLFLFCCLGGATSHATLAIPGDLTIDADYRFDVRPGETFADGEATYTGTIFSRVGSANTQTDTSYSDGSVTGGNNPIIATLTHHGNGVVGGGNGFGGTTTLTSTRGFASYRADTDLDGTGGSTPVVITNNSLVQAYELFFTLTFDHEVTATGPDAVIRSDLDLEIDGFREFNTELISDTFNENANVIDGEIVGDDGGTLSRSGQFSFSIIVDPDDSWTVGLDYTMETLDIVGFDFYGDGETAGEASYYLSLDNIVAVPEAGAVLQLSCLSIGLAVFARRKAKK